MKGQVPKFLVIGAAKSGTTTLHHYLKRDPRIFLPDRKEPEFFSHDDVFARGVDWYLSLFDPASSDQLCGEASTAYTRSPQFPDSAKRIHKLLPNVRLIYVLRNPVDRAFSHFVHRWTKEVFPGRPFTMSFENYVRQDPECIDSSRYMLQIGKYLEYFPRSQVLILFLEDIAVDPVLAIAEIQRFIGLAPFDVVGQRPLVENRGGARDYLRCRIKQSLNNLPGVHAVLNKIPQQTRTIAFRLFSASPIGRQIERQWGLKPLHDAVRRQFVSEFRRDVVALSTFVGRDLSSVWGEPDWAVPALSVEHCVQRGVGACE